MRAHAREPARRRAQRGRGALRHLRDRGQLDHALPAPRAFLRPDHPGRLPGIRRHPGALAGRQHTGPGAGRVPAHLPARGAQGVREGLQQRAAACGRQQGQERDLRRRGGNRHRVEQVREHRRRPAGRAAAAAARIVRPAGLRQAPGGTGRQGAVRDLRRRAARRPARPFLPRRRPAGPGGLRAHRDLGRLDREQDAAQQDRDCRHAPAGGQHADRRRRRDPHQRGERLHRLPAQPRSDRRGARCRGLAALR